MRRKYKILLTISEFVFSSKVRRLCDFAFNLNQDTFDIEIGAMDVGHEATSVQNRTRKDRLERAVSAFQKFKVPTERWLSPDFVLLSRRPMKASSIDCL